MPLTHVCMWSGHGWKRVTAYDLAKCFRTEYPHIVDSLCVIYAGST